MHITQYASLFVHFLRRLDLKKLWCGQYKAGIIKALLPGKETRHVFTFTLLLIELNNNKCTPWTVWLSYLDKLEPRVNLRAHWLKCLMLSGDNTAIVPADFRPLKRLLYSWCCALLRQTTGWMVQMFGEQCIWLWLHAVTVPTLISIMIGKRETTICPLYSKGTKEGLIGRGKWTSNYKSRHKALSERGHTQSKNSLPFSLQSKSLLSQFGTDPKASSFSFRLTSKVSLIERQAINPSSLKIAVYINLCQQAIYAIALLRHGTFMQLMTWAREHIRTHQYFIGRQRWWFTC